MRWISYLDGAELVGSAILEAPILYPACTRVAVRGIGSAADYREGKEVEVEHRDLIPRECVGSLLSPEETQNLPQRCGTG
jgi:hypothetical protein